MITKPKEENILGQATATAPSPFVDIKDERAMKWEENGWFLVQLPTRLPKTVKDESPEPESADSDSAHLAGATAAPDAVTSNQPTLTSAAAELATTQVTLPPVQTDRFDNNLTTAVPGRLGKIIVYKSGKTVLVLEGPSGKPKVSRCTLLWLRLTSASQGISDNPFLLRSASISLKASPVGFASKLCPWMLKRANS